MEHLVNGLPRDVNLMLLNLHLQRLCANVTIWRTLLCSCSEMMLWVAIWVLCKHFGHTSTGENNVSIHFFLPVFVLALQWSSYIFENNHDYWMYSFHLGVSSLLCHVSYTQVSFLSFFLFQINRTFLACARLYLVWPPTCDDFIKMYIFLTLEFTLL